jgi:hypothetical protein
MAEQRDYDDEAISTIVEELLGFTRGVEPVDAERIPDEINRCIVDVRYDELRRTNSLDEVPGESAAAAREFQNGVRLAKRRTKLEESFWISLAFRRPRR